MLAWPLFFLLLFSIFSFKFGIKRVEGTNCGMAFWDFRLLFSFFIMNYGGDRLDLKKDGPVCHCKTNLTAT